MHPIQSLILDKTDSFLTPHISSTKPIHPDMQMRDRMINKIRGKFLNLLSGEEALLNDDQRITLWGEILQQSNLPIDFLLCAIKELVFYCLKTSNRRLHSNIKMSSIDDDPHKQNDFKFKNMYLGKYTTLTDLARFYLKKIHDKQNQKEKDFKFYCKLLLCIEGDLNLLNLLIRSTENESTSRKYLFSILINRLVRRNCYYDENTIEVPVKIFIKGVLPFLQNHLYDDNAKFSAECLQAFIGILCFCDELDSKFIFKKSMDIIIDSNTHPRVKMMGNRSFSFLLTVEHVREKIKNIVRESDNELLLQTWLFQLKNYYDDLEIGFYKIFFLKHMEAILAK